MSTTKKGRRRRRYKNPGDAQSTEEVRTATGSMKGTTTPRAVAGRAYRLRSAAPDEPSASLYGFADPSTSPAITNGATPSLPARPAAARQRRVLTCRRGVVSTGFDPVGRPLRYGALTIGACGCFSSVHYQPALLPGAGLEPASTDDHSSPRSVPLSYPRCGAGSATKGQHHRVSQRPTMMHLPRRARPPSHARRGTSTFNNRAPYAGLRAISA